MLEIYNEALRDLLSDDRSAANRLDILATQASGCNVPGATQVEVCSAAEVAALMAAGARQRATSETKMNDRSSRSHQILTVIVDGVNEVTHARSHGCLHLIDLAGSERVGKSEASGARPRALGMQCVRECACAEGARRARCTESLSVLVCSRPVCCNAAAAALPQASGWWRRSTSTSRSARWAT